MRHGTQLAVGLSVGSTALAAVTSDHAVHRSPVQLVAGQAITDFVDRVGDPVGILAADGSSHRAERLLAEALRETAYAATRGRPLPELVAVSVPAHWRPAAVDALRSALVRVPEWTRRPPVVLSDVDAALTALNADPGLPIRGVIAVCDFGGSGMSITLVDAGNDYRPIGPTVRHPDFAGDMVDQALLSHLIDELAGAGSVDLNSTSAIGSLWRLRARCREAKERLSAGAVTAIPVDLPEFRGDVRITRTELDTLLRDPLAKLLHVLLETLRCNGIHPSRLSAVASIGGGAAISAVTTTLSEQLRVPVVTKVRPTLLAATGAALRVLRGPADESATALAKAVPMAPKPNPVVPPSDQNTALGALAWSQVPDDGQHDDFGDFGDVPAPRTGLAGARPLVEFELDVDGAVAELPVRWYRRPAAVTVAAILVFIAAVSATGVVLTNDATVVQVSDPTPSIHTAAPEPEPAPAPVAAQTAAPPRTVIATPAPVTHTQVVQRQQAPVTVQAPPAAPPAPVTATVTETATETATATPTETAAPSAEAPTPTPTPAPSTEPAPSSQPPAPSSATTVPLPQWIPTIPPIPTIPGLPAALQPPGTQP